MKRYKKLFNKFFRKIEKIDMAIDVDSLSDRELEIMLIIRACRNKLAECYNAIDDDAWEMPDWKLR